MGNRIQASIRSNQIDFYQNILIEGCAYMIQNFNLVDNSGSFKYTHHPYRINFHEKTSIRKRECCSIDNFIYKFTDFSHIRSKQLDTSYSYEIIGEIISTTGERQSNNGIQTRRIELELRDLNVVVLKCTLCGTYVDQVRSFLDNHEAEPVVMVLISGKIKEFKGSFQISNSYNATRIKFNPAISEVQHFIERIQRGDLTLCKKIAQIDCGSSFNIKEVFSNHHYYKHLAAIRNISQASKVVFRAKISHFETSRGWSYLGCMRCGKKVQSVGDDQQCQLCNVSSTKICRRYRLEIHVIDNFAAASLILFDKEAFQLLGIPADRLYMTMFEVGDPDAFPDELDQVVGKYFLFFINVSNYNITQKSSSYTVSALEKNIALLDNALEKYTQELFDSPPVSTTNIESPTQSKEVSSNCPFPSQAMQEIDHVDHCMDSLDEKLQLQASLPTLVKY